MVKQNWSGKTFKGPFTYYDMWRLVHYRFLPDSLVYRLCLHANGMVVKGAEDIEQNMWVEDPIAFAQCVSLSHLTVNPKAIKSRLAMMDRTGNPMWEELVSTSKKIFLPINYPTQDHWLAGKSFTRHLQVMSHSQVIHKS